MIRLKTKEEIKHLRAGGKILSGLLDDLARMVAPGVTTLDLNDRAMEIMEEVGAEPVLLGYHPEFAPRPFPAAICVSINDIVEHGIPNEKPRTIQDGDIVSIDVTLGYEGMIVDSGRTIPAGTVAPEVLKLIEVTKEARAVGIKAAQVDAQIGDIGHAIEEFVRPFGYGIVEELCGHGVGYAVHEDPIVPNVGRAGTGPLIQPGLVLAIEPMLTLGKKDVVFDEEDGYTVSTKDGSMATHFEHTVVITEKGPEVVTA